MVRLSESALRAWASAAITGIDVAILSRDAIWGIFLRRFRRESASRSIDRLTARVVWGRGRHTRLAIAGPRGVLP